MKAAATCREEIVRAAIALKQDAGEISMRQIAQHIDQLLERLARQQLLTDALAGTPDLKPVRADRRGAARRIAREERSYLRESAPARWTDGKPRIECGMKRRPRALGHAGRALGHDGVIDIGKDKLDALHEDLHGNRSCPVS